MTQIELIHALDHWDAQGFWAFSLETLRLLFPESERSLHKALARHERSGLLLNVTRGWYINPRARSRPADPLSALVPLLRPWELSYLTLESALSEAGAISQIPNRLTLMTTGRSQIFETAYGTLEFVHTKRPAAVIAAGLRFDSGRGLYVATLATAKADLRRVGRNLELLQATGADDEDDEDKQ